MNKKLLLLGGSRYLIPVIKTAHKLGISVVTMDNLPDQPAHSHGDGYCNVSITDRQEVLKQAERLWVDGVMSFACDPGVTTAACVAKQLGLPSPGPAASIELLQNKGAFRRFLADHHFNVPQSECYDDMDRALKEADRFRWPVMVKPADSAGSKGVSMADGRGLLKQSIQNALRYSRSGEFVIEEYIKARRCASDSDCFSINGKMVFLSFSSQWFDRDAGNPYVPAGFSWPSSISAPGRKVLENEIQRLAGLLGMTTGIYNIETRESVDGVPYLMEVSPRGGGNRLAEMIRYVTGVDLIEASVRAAAGLELTQLPEGPPPGPGYWAEIILHADKAGYFDGIWISGEIESDVVELDIWAEKGDWVEEFTGADRTLGTVILKSDSPDQLEHIMRHTKQYIRVLVRQGG